MRATDVEQNTDWVRPPSIFSLRSENKKGIEALDSVPFLTVAFQPLAKNDFFLQAEGVHGRHLTQWMTSAPDGFVSTPKFALEKITIRFVSQGSIIRRNGRSDFLGIADTGMLVPFDEMVAEEASAGFRAFAGTVDRSALLASHIALEGEDDQPLPNFLPLVEVTSAPFRSFKHNFHLVYQRLHEGLHEDDLIYALLEEMVIYQFLTAWPRQQGKSAPTASLQPSWQVRRAMEYIDANLARKITLAEIASVAQTGVRSLQLSFRKELGKTPVQWILERRLRGVQKELVCSSSEFVSISATARRWGFVHMADFARRYRQLFNESPVETTRRRR